MNDVSFDALTRRASLASLGAAGVAALALPFTADAKNKTKKKAKKKCQSQIDPCISSVSELICMGDPDCLALATTCCQLLATCDFDGFIACLNA